MIQLPVIHPWALLRTQITKLRDLPVGMVVVVGALLVTGLVFIYSSTNDFSTGELAYRTGESYAHKQITFLVISLGLALIAAIVDYRHLANHWIGVFLLAVFGLVLVLVIGKEINGAKSWIEVGPLSLQISEFCKLLYILFLASYLKACRRMNPFVTVVIPIAATGVLLLLMLMQPDFGTAMVFIPVYFAMLWVSGIPLKLLLPKLFFGLAIMPALYLSGMFKDHQMKRIDTWLASLMGTSMDTTGDGYQVWMSLNAIGSGGGTGKGLFEGMFSQYDYLPERHTDFIFSVLAEETGFVGALVFSLAFLALILFCLRTGLRSKDPFGVMVCVGVAAMFFSQFMINVGMTCGIMPVTGIPLPFVSYGGSSLMASLLAIGIVLSVHLHPTKPTGPAIRPFDQR